jgi:hypothetical protein
MYSSYYYKKPRITHGMNQVAQNVQSITVPNTGHWIPKEQPQFVIDQLSRFFGNSTNTITTSIIPPTSSPNSTTSNTTALDDRTAPMGNLLGERAG